MKHKLNITYGIKSPQLGESCAVVTFGTDDRDSCYKSVVDCLLRSAILGVFAGVLVGVPLLIIVVIGGILKW